MFKRLLIAVLLLGILIMVVRSIPDLKRYLKIRSM